MTYNFDPERWLEMQLAHLDDQRDRGELDAAAYDRARAELERRHLEMIDRLDGTYRLPGHTRRSGADGDGSS